MVDVLATMTVASLLALAACLLLVLLGVLPFVQAVDLADRLRFSTLRWGLISLMGIAAGALAGWWVLDGGHLRLLLLPAAAVTWLVPGVISLMDPAQTSVGGRQGRHQR